MSSASSAAPPPRAEFDVIAEMIRDISLGSTSVPTKVSSAVSKVGRKLKSSFTDATGKRRKLDNDATTSTTPAAKRRVPLTRKLLDDDATTSTTPGATLPATVTPATPAHCDSIGAMLINRDMIVPPHVKPLASVIQPLHKRLLPSDIVRLMAGDEILVVIPAGNAIQKGKKNEADKQRAEYRRAFESLLYYTL
jgi:hypothetical protein